MRVEGKSCLKLVALLLSLCVCVLCVCVSGDLGLQDNIKAVNAGDSWNSYISPIMDAQFHLENALSSEDCSIDLSYKDSGLALIVAKSERPILAKISQGDRSETFYIHNDGTQSAVLLPFGNGDYEITILEKKEDKVGSVKYQTAFSVWSMNDLQAFCNATDYVPFNKNSEYVKEASRLKKMAESDEQLVALIVQQVMRHLDYDQSMTEVGHRPDLDLVWTSRKAVCRDYAVITAAMLRSQGIPTKVLYGDVMFSNGTKGYHAWNEYYAGNAGWVRLDVTYMERGESLDHNNDFEILYEASKVF